MPLSKRCSSRTWSAGSRVNPVREHDRSLDRYVGFGGFASISSTLRTRTYSKTESDVEGVLTFAEHVLMNARSLWVNATSGDKRTLQRALFPEGLAWGASGFGTAVPAARSVRYGLFRWSKMEWRPHGDPVAFIRCGVPPRRRVLGNNTDFLAICYFQTAA